MSVSLPTYIYAYRKAGVLNSTDVSILRAIHTLPFDTKYPSIGCIARIVRKSSSTVKRAIYKCRDMGILKVTPRYRARRGGQTSNLYRIMPAPSKSDLAYELAVIKKSTPLPAETIRESKNTSSLSSIKVHSTNQTTIPTSRKAMPRVVTREKQASDEAIAIAHQLAIQHTKAIHIDELIKRTSIDTVRQAVNVTILARQAGKVRYSTLAYLEGTAFNLHPLLMDKLAKKRERAAKTEENQRKIEALMLDVKAREARAEYQYLLTLNINTVPGFIREKLRQQQQLALSLTEEEFVQAQLQKAI